MKFEALLLVLIFVETQSSDDSDYKLDFRGLANKSGLQTEEYDVPTEDGYILKLFRIPSNGTPVLLQHGFLDSADVFILRANTSLAFLLSKNGHDVWIGNIRGNKYSRKHIKLDPDEDEKFWDFSFHEHGYYDLPAMIDYILDVTGKSKINYIGHSQGTTIAFILGSSRPEYNEKINLFIALAPVVFLQNTTDVLRTALQYAPDFDGLLKILSKDEIFGPKSIEMLLAEKCEEQLVSYLCLKLAIFPFTGYDYEEFEVAFAPLFFAHFPSGSSRKNLIHFSQIANSGRFANYDYGLQNIERHGTISAPKYNLENVTMPIALIVSKNDGFASVEDTNRLKAILPNVVEYHIIERPLFNHIGFVLGRNTYSTLYPRILKLLQQD